MTKTLRDADTACKRCPLHTPRETTMDPASTTPRFLRFTRAARKPAAPDPADMGTCFGLEMTLDVPPAKPAVADAPQASHWWQRLAAHKPARN